MGVSDRGSTQALHYLPVEVSRQVFAIPMADIAAIHQLGGGKPDEAADLAAGDKEQANILVVDLRCLFSATTSPGGDHPAYAVVISIPTFTYAMLVDTVRPPRHAKLTEQFALPPLVSGGRYPFSGVLREPDALLLIMDTRLLAETLRRMQPDLVREVAHGT